MTEVKCCDWAYAAAALDGEGCIVANTTGGYLRMSVDVSNCDRRLAEWLKGKFGGGILVQKRAKAHHRDCYHWNLWGKGCSPFLEGVLPHLKLKKRRAELAILLAATIGDSSGLSEEAWQVRYALLSMMEREAA